MYVPVSDVYVLEPENHIFKSAGFPRRECGRAGRRKDLTDRGDAMGCIMQLSISPFSKREAESK